MSLHGVRERSGMPVVARITTEAALQAATPRRWKEGGSREADAARAPDGRKGRCQPASKPAGGATAGRVASHHAPSPALQLACTIRDRIALARAAAGS